MLEADLFGSLLGHQEPEGVLGRLPLVQEQSPELLLLDPGEGVVDNGQHLERQQPGPVLKTFMYEGRGCSTAVERTPLNREVVGSIPAAGC